MLIGVCDRRDEDEDLLHLTRLPTWLLLVALAVAAAVHILLLQ